METRELGRSGVSVTRIVLGCGNFGGVGSSPAFFGQGIPREEAPRIMDAAWELGITAFDTADAYGGGRSETWIGEWLAARGRETRDAIVAGRPHRATGAHAAHIVEILDAIATSATEGRAVDVTSSFPRPAPLRP